MIIKSLMLMCVKVIVNNKIKIYYNIIPKKISKIINEYRYNDVLIDINNSVVCIHPIDECYDDDYFDDYDDSYSNNSWDWNYGSD